MTSVRLGDLGRTYGGLTGKTKHDFRTGDARYITFLDVINNPCICFPNLGRVRVDDGEHQNPVRVGDVLFNGSSETPEEVALPAVVAFETGDNTYLNSFCFGYRLAPGSTVNRTYLTHYLRSDLGRATVTALAQGATRYNISKARFLDLRLDLPPIEEQRRIAEALDDADALIAGLERMIVKKEVVKQGMMQQLLTGRTRLPGFTAPWQTHRLGDHVVYLRTVPLSRAQLDTSSPIKYLHYGDIHTSDAVLLDAANAPMPRAESARTATADHLRPGDLVLVDASEDLDGVCKSVEVTAVPQGGVIAGLHTIAARFSKEVFANGYKAYLQFLPEFRTQVRRIAAGTKVIGVSASRLADIDLSLPPTAEQRAIARVLTNADEEIRAFRVRLEKARAIKEGMMQQLITGRTRLPFEELG